MNLGGVPTRGGLVLEGLPSLMAAWFMDLHERPVTCLPWVCVVVTYRYDSYDVLDLGGVPAIAVGSLWEADLSW